MTGDPTRGQPRPAAPALRAACWPLSAFFAAGLTGSCTLLAAVTVSAGAPWQVPALDAAAAIAGALALRWILQRSRRGPCAAVYGLGGEPVFLSLRRAGHRGGHREGTVGWDASGLYYAWRGHRRGRSR